MAEDRKTEYQERKVEKAVGRIARWMDGSRLVRRGREKAEAFWAIIRLVPNVGGPGPAERNMMCRVAQSIIVYGAPVWNGALKMGKFRVMVMSLERNSALWVISAYRRGQRRRLWSSLA